MRYPKIWGKINKAIAVAAGCLALLIACFSVYEAIVRYIFSSPTSWTLNVSCYILVWSIFLGSSYAFQEGSHVGVDMIKDWVDKKTKGEKRIPRRTMSIIGYILTFVFLIVVLYGSVELIHKALMYHTLTMATNPIPAAWLYLGMIIGTILMLITLVLIILDLLSGNDKYL